MISGKAVIHQNVKLDEDTEVEDFVVIGAPVKGEHPETLIGDHCVIRSHTVIYSGNVIGERFQTGNKANIRERNVIGDDVSIGTLSVVEHHVKIGNGVRIHSQVFIPEYCIIEDGAWLGPNVVLTNARYPNTPDTKTNLKGVHVKKGARIGANSTILPGITIGEHSLIGAGSLVSKDTEPYGIYVGNPARRTGWSCECGKPLNSDLECSSCGAKYTVEQGIMKMI